MNKIDVTLNVYGKPYHTLVSILSLLKYSGHLIDKIFLLEEYQHPHGDNIGFIFQLLPKEKIIHIKADHFIDYPKNNGLKYFDYERINDEKYRHSIRYQYAFEKTDKEYLFIMHNDVLFTGDIIGNMLEKITGTNYVGIGHIGACWNCPAHYAKVCDGDNYDKYNPTYEEAISIVEKYPSPRTRSFVEVPPPPGTAYINQCRPMPFPECRLNEYSAMINTKILKPLVMPVGNIKPIGDYTFDIGNEFFRGLFMAGYRFINYKGGEVKHAWSIPEISAGHPLDYNKKEYDYAEEIARMYLIKNLI